MVQKVEDVDMLVDKEEVRYVVQIHRADGLVMPYETAGQLVTEGAGSELPLVWRLGED